MPRAPSVVRRLRAAVAAAVADLPAGAAIGVACSGGADSVALLDAAVAARAPAPVVALHVDHRLHPGSGEVAAAVAAVAARLGATAELLPVRVPRGASLEDQARAARYAALDAAAARLELAAVLTGHTARDQAETILLRVVRGTGPAGLAGIPAVRGRYRRPLLAIARAEVEAYVAARGLPAIADPMNDDERFARVRARRRLVPALAAENPRIEDALLRLGRAAAEWAAAIDGAAAALAPPGATRIAAAALAAAGPAAGKRALQRLAAPAPLEAEHLDAAWALAAGPARGSRGVDVPGARIERVYDELVVVRPPAAARAPAGLVVRGPDGPYEVRAWRPGDRMRPPRLRGRSRKLSDLYADARVPRRARAGARVVIRARDGAIVWAEHLGGAHGVEIDVIPQPCPIGEGSPQG